MKFRIIYEDGYYFARYRKWGTWWFIKNSYSKNIEHSRNACKDFLTGANEPKIVEKFELKEKFKHQTYMRDVKRIRKFCNELADIWESKCPDWRFSQLILNVLSSNKINSNVAFYVEDDEMMDFIKSYFKIEN